MAYPTITHNQRMLMMIGIENGSIPKILYKYRTTEQALMFLDNSNAYFAKSKEFNDPFDCKMNIETNVTIEALANWLKQQNYTGDIFEEARKRLSDPVKLHEITQEAVEHAIATLGIFCCSIVCDSILMWAHYAHNHEGVCLEFDISEDVDFFCFPKKVEYDMEYPSIDYYTHSEEVTNALFHKYKAWEYEKEYRIIKSGFSGLHEMNPLVLKNIIVGCKTSDNDLQRVMEKVKQNNVWNHVGFKRVVMDGREYKLHVSDV